MKIFNLTGQFILSSHCYINLMIIIPRSTHLATLFWSNFPIPQCDTTAQTVANSNGQLVFRNNHTTSQPDIHGRKDISISVRSESVLHRARLIDAWVDSRTGRGSVRCSRFADRYCRNKPGCIIYSPLHRAMRPRLYNGSSSGGRLMKIVFG